VSEFLFDPENVALGLFAGDGNPVTTPPTDTGDTQTGDVTLTPAHHIDLGHVYHVQYPQMKCDENSERGIRYAHRHGWAIDLDMQKDKVGTILIDHWQELMLRDGWYDPTGKMDRHRKLNTMTPDEWGRLTTKHHDKLLTVDQAFELCGKLNVPIRLEPKAGNHWTLADAQHIFALHQQHHVRTVIATLSNDRGWRKRVRLFRQAGFPDVRRFR
jgi:hypothetical protein